MTSSSPFVLAVLLLLHLAHVNSSGGSDNTADASPSSSPSSSPPPPLVNDPFKNGTITYYEVFNVDTSVTESEVKRAYRRLAVKYHPDKVQGDAALKSAYEKIFIKIVMAFETLTNDKARGEYDEMVKVGVYEYDVSAWMRATRGYSDGDLAREARERYQRYEEAEKRAFWLSIVGTFVVVVLPILYVLQDMNKRRKSRAQVTRELLADKRMQRKRDHESLTVRKAAQAVVMAKARADQAEERDGLMAQQHSTKGVVAGSFVAAASSSGGSGGGGGGMAFKEVVRTDAWTSDELSALAKAVAKYPGGTMDRWDRVAEVVNAAGDGVSVRLAKDVIRRAQEVKMRSVAESTARPTPAAVAAAAAAASASTRTIATTSKEVAAAAVTVPPPAEEWTTEQQLQLESALKTYPSSMEKQRWTLIAAAVAGKTRKQCVARFKYIKQKLMASKQAAANL